MAKKRSGKKFTVQEKANYHKDRARDPYLSKEKREYSRIWLEAFRRPMSDEKLNSLDIEYNELKKLQLSKEDHIYYKATLRGAKAARKLPVISDKNIKGYLSIPKIK